MCKQVRLPYFDKASMCSFIDKISYYVNFTIIFNFFIKCGRVIFLMMILYSVSTSAADIPVGLTPTNSLNSQAMAGPPSHITVSSVESTAPWRCFREDHYLNYQAICPPAWLPGETIRGATGTLYADVEEPTGKLLFSGRTRILYNLGSLNVPFIGCTLLDVGLPYCQSMTIPSTRSFTIPVTSTHPKGGPYTDIIYIRYYFIMSGYSLNNPRVAPSAPYPYGRTDISFTYKVNSGGTPVDPDTPTPTCLINPTSINVNHGSVSITQSDGHIAMVTAEIICDESATGEFYFQGTTSNDRYKDITLSPYGTTRVSYSINNNEYKANGSENLPSGYSKIFFRSQLQKNMKPGKHTGNTIFIFNYY
ncbi:hypothetical protein O4O00_21955 [Citrobacter sedlakii]|uniref:hypothetical protein n=1 Tax=Citrobacter sedlakii TaxID=67826 RepID=UPI0022B4FC3F|nr:hypothetical protein [Citrobacter sedlakii]MCZ4677021.1 hypothetical protein [Citrobacter sedlakii]MDR5007078.1 hypothetical protein [Citrobacter sedlakii]